MQGEIEVFSPAINSKLTSPDAPGTTLLFGYRKWNLVGVWSLEFGVWSLEFGVWSLEFGVWSLEFGVWSLEFGV